MAKIKRVCSVPDCGKPHEGLGFCKSHRQRFKRHGDPLGGGPATRNGEAVAFFEKALGLETDDCIEWPFAKCSFGYGRIRTDGRYTTVHSEALKRRVGPAPHGMEACHKPVICHNPACFNYRHLRWDTRAANNADKRLDGTSYEGDRHHSKRPA